MMGFKQWIQDRIHEGKEEREEEVEQFSHDFAMSFMKSRKKEIEDVLLSHLPNVIGPNEEESDKK
jgi:hypothetical protein